MKDKRTQRAKLNMITTFVNQLVSTLCGILIPQAMIGAFGSAIYGATTSISQFLSYVSLLESGIGSVARAELYKPLAEKNNYQVSTIYHALKRFFARIGIVFIFYIVVLAYFYNDIANVSVLSREYSFWLVCAIGLSTAVDYLCGISNQMFITADQKKYIVNTAITAVRVLNTVLTLILVNSGTDVLIVKLVSSIVIIIRPVFLSIYVKKSYSLPKVNRKEAVLKQKWTGLGQHFAYFIHSNTDIIVLTLFADLKIVAVYSVYYLVVFNMRSLVFSFAGGMESELGDMIARNEKEKLVKAYRRYQCIINTITLIAFGSTAALVVPFVKLYTANVSDANYIQPAFALIFVMVEAFNCISLACSTLPISANRLRQTQWGAFGEALINIVLSCILIRFNPLLGVIIGSLAAEIFKFVFYSVYAAKHILKTSVFKELIRQASVLFVLFAVSFVGINIFNAASISNYFQWALAACGTVVVMTVIALIVGRILYPKELNALINALKNKIKYR